MPFYEYQCAACGQPHEALQKVSDRPLRKCPACGRPALKRLVSAPVFRLKGGGWYETDFKGDAEKKRNLAGEKEPAAAEAPAADKGGEAKTEAKSEAKSEAKPAGTKADAPARPAVATKPKAARPRAARRRATRR